MNAERKFIKDKLRVMPKAELLEIAELCGLDEMEKTILLDVFYRKKTVVQISLDLHICDRTFENHFAMILQKIVVFRRWLQKRNTESMHNLFNLFTMI